MPLLSHSPRGRASGLIRDERFAFVRFGSNRNERKAAEAPIDRAQGTQTPGVHARIHNRMPECAWAHAHKGRRIQGYWQLSLSPTSGGSLSNEVPWGENFLLFPGSNTAVRPNYRLTQGWMPTDRSKLVHMNTCSRYQHASNNCAHLRTKTWRNLDRGRADLCADSMLYASKF